MTNNNQNNCNDDISTALSPSPHVSMTVAEYNYYLKQHKHLPMMKKNQLSIFGIDLSKDNQNQIIVKSFIRSTVEKPVHLKTSPIVLSDQTGNVIARTVVDFTNLGTLPPKTSRPWTFVFPKEAIRIQNINMPSAWSLAFVTSAKHKLDLSDMGEKKISEFSKAKLEKIIQQAPLKKDEFSLMGLSAKQKDSGELTVTLLIRNGTRHNLQLKQLPLKLFDANGQHCAQGTFKLDHLTIKANTSKPITLVYPESSVLTKEMDLSRFSIQHVN